MSKPVLQIFPTKDFLLRFISALVAIPLVLLLIWLGGWYLFFGCACVLAGATYELSGILSRINKRPIWWLSLLLGLLVMYLLQIPVLGREIFTGLSIVFLLATMVSIWSYRFRSLIPIKLFSTTLTALYIGIPIACLFWLRIEGTWWLLSVLFATWANDTGAFIFGRSFGVHKLLPRISPNKTWEGFVGGLICAVVVTVTCMVLHLGVSWQIAGIVGATIGVAATIGDLAESALKRLAAMKDSGTIMPGHGGLLDRIDGLLWSSVVMYLFVLLVKR